MIYRHILPDEYEHHLDGGLLEALFHDVGEGLTGDIPHTFKHGEKNGIKPALDNREWQHRGNLGVAFDTHGSAMMYVKVADWLEGMLYCVEQLELGIKPAAPPFNKFLDALSNKYPLLCSSNKEVDAIVNWLLCRYEACTRE